MKINRTPTKDVKPPQMMNNVRHGAREMLDCPIPYIMRAPIIWETPFMETHVATRMGCSLFTYQFDVMMMKAGETVPVA
jgi:hypothetical protein